MADDLKVVAELSLKDALTGPASKAVARVSADARKAAQEQAKSATSARTVADALAEVNKRGQEASRSVNGVAQALAHAAHTPFTSAAAQMQNLREATGRTRREMAALLKVANRAGYVVGAGVRMAGNVATSTAAQVAGGLVTARSLAHVASMDSRYAAFKADTNMTKEQAAAFKSRVQGAAATAHVGEGDVMTLAEVMHAVSGNKGFSADALDIFAKAQKASGSNADDMGALAGLMLRMGIKERGEIERGLSGAVTLGDRGGFTLRDFSRHGVSAAAAYAAQGRGGSQAFMELNTALQLAREGTGTSDKAGSSVHALIKELAAKSKKGTRARNRIKVFDEQGNMRSLLDIMKDMVKATGGDMKKLKKLGLSEEAQAAVQSMMKQYRETGNFDFMDAYKVTGNEADLDRKWRENSDTIDSALTALGNSWARIMDSLFTAPLKGAARVITDMSEGARDTTVALGALGMGALALFAKVKAGQALLGMARKFMAKGGAAEAVEKAAKPANKSVQAMEQAAAQKKNVVREVKAAAKDAPLNITAPAEGSAAQAVEAAGKSAAKGGFMGTMRNLAKRVPILNFLIGGAEVAATELDDSLTRAQKNAAHTATAGGFAGSVAGAKVGAAAGVFAGPVGMVIGGLLGALVGTFAGSKLGEAVGGFAFGSKEKEAPEPKPIEETVMQAAQLIQPAPLAATLNLTVELDGEVIARKVEQAQLRQATRR